jgi:hypothetical protein
MSRRCLDPRHPRYRDYGARGVSVCSEWRVFRHFLRDMGDPPEGLTLERIDNDQGYSRENCKWATRAEQNSNRRSTRRLTLAGKTQPIRHWEIELGLSRGALNQRLRRGWDVSEILTASTRPSALIKIAAANRRVA